MSIRGIVRRIESKQVYVTDTQSGQELECVLRGKFKLDYRLKKDKLITSDVAVVGDFVDVTMNKEGTGLITRIAERKNFISRKAPKVKGGGKRGERFEQVLVANVDNFFAVLSVDKPAFNNKTLDRYLVIGESSKIPTSLIINKTDLIANGGMNDWISLYRSIGYRVFPSCVKQNSGLAEIRAAMEGKVNLFWGPSGVGKSSLVNALFPGMRLRVGDISDFSNKGMHTTVTVQMLEVHKNTFIVDTPGVREVEPFGIQKQDLAHYFPDFLPYINDCKFSTCTHEHEPGCAVMIQVQDGKISAERYDSYLRLLDTIEDDLFF